MPKSSLSQFARWVLVSVFAITPMMATPDHDAFSGLEAYVQATMELLHPSSAAIVVSRGEQVIYENYLTGSFEGLPETPIDASALFPLASATKSFTAGVLMSLVQDGVVDLDAPISDHLPFMLESGNGPHSRNSVTLRHLASHTSGLQYPNGERYSEPLSVEAITEPGGDFCYSETGMNLLQATLEAATGKSWPELLQSRILNPLQLKSTRYLAALSADLPLVPAQAGKFEDPAQHYFFTQASSLTGSGLYSTARDLNRYSQLWAQRGTVGEVRLFSAELAQEATRTQAIFDYNGAHYGLLWWVFPERGAIVMSGATHSVSAITPETQTAVTVMRNYYGEIPEGFVFHEDKMKLVDFALSLGALPKSH